MMDEVTRGKEMATFTEWKAAVNPAFDIEDYFATALTSADTYAVENLIAILISGANIYEYGAGATAANPAQVANSWAMNDKGVATLTLKGKVLNLTSSLSVTGGESYPTPVFGTP
jgi:hypothetical protein